MHNLFPCFLAPFELLVVLSFILFLFQLSARSDREFRALEVCEMMLEPHTLQLAIKYACRLKYMQLAERISEVVQRKSAEQAEEVEEEEEEEVVHKVQRSRSSLCFGN